MRPTSTTRETGRKYIDYARAHGLPIIVVVRPPLPHRPGDQPRHQRPDHLLRLRAGHGGRGGLSGGLRPRKVLNQWTFQARMYNAARYVCTQPDMEVIQLVSFGCGIDAITGDEMRSILEEGGKLYTQLKIDDISNLGAVKIRIRIPDGGH